MLFSRLYLLKGTLLPSVFFQAWDQQETHWNPGDIKTFTNIDAPQNQNPMWQTHIVHIFYFIQASHFSVVFFKQKLTYRKKFSAKFSAILVKLFCCRISTFSQGIHPKTCPLANSKTKNNQIMVRRRSSLKAITLNENQITLKRKLTKYLLNQNGLIYCRCM